ncbi:MAG: DnaJ domain-containing protein [Pseudomonadota bacterium]|nr:DnaJ domain-containing protein [Pseudomonadota bacterium]
MANKRKNDYAPHIPPETAPLCHAEGCAERGAYKAPLSRDSLQDYHWFCLDHIREHNQKWDFFAGMDAEQIDLFRRDAVHGHRPTWSREQRIRHSWQLQDALYEFLHPDAPKPKARPSLPPKLRKSLAALDMEYPYTLQQLKTKYRALARKHHPDANRGDPQSEERFKKITAAYQHLLAHGKEALPA